ncbi:MAG TPA: MBL fold metallo-hydrolase [Anaeromyxobacteraceae bacterium]|nr:MBL fold metallo-hydrolase [Anaeromyxobacteraceae bacterium]
MRRFVALAMAVAWWPALVPAQQDRDYSKVEIKVHKVQGSVYMLEGAGGNIGVSVGDDGIVIIDDQFAPLASKIEAALRSLGDRKVRFVVNTHWHFDHVGGNAYFQQQGPVLAHENVRRRMQEGGELMGGQVKVPPASKDALPVVTFNDRASLHLNGEEIRAIHYPGGHTDGDAVVFFTRSNVVHMGDDFVTYGFPFIDLDSGGSVKGMAAAVRAVIAAAPPDAKIIPGHGKISTVADLRAYADMLEDAAARVQKGIRAGKTADDLKREKVLAGYEKWSGEFVSTDKFIDTLYLDLTGKKPGQFQKHN